MKRDRTKIVCTLSGKLAEEEILSDMIIKGMDVARLNFSHADYESAKEIIDLLKKIRKRLNTPVGIMLDTKGPESRVYGLKKPVELKRGDKITVESYDGDENLEKIKTNRPRHLYTNLPGLEDLVEKGNKVLLSDGMIEGCVSQIMGKRIEIEILNKGKLRSKAHLNIPGIDYPLPFMSKKDADDIKFAVDQDLDYIALSFVRSAEDIFQVKDLIYETNPNSEINLISKIEHRRAIENLDELIDHSDGIMVARGDLGVELEIEDVPIMQKKIIQDCYRAGKSVIVATQMLESMMEHRLPSRAEVSDVANACFDLASAVMLSGETAIGKYPLLVVETMQKIIAKVEDSFAYEDFLKTQLEQIDPTDLTSVLTYSAVASAYRCNAKVLIVFTRTGYSARMIARLRPKLPLHAITLAEKVYNQLAIAWGVIPHLIEDNPDFEVLIKRAMLLLKREDLIETGDNVVIVAGVPLGIHGKTNMIRIETV
jgi:pyruvate kinase